MPPGRSSCGTHFLASRSFRPRPFSSRGTAAAKQYHFTPGEAPMKRQLLRFTAAAGILLAASSATASAQGFGVMAGANFADVSGDDIEGSDVDSRTGFVGGVFYEHKLGTSIS